MSASTKLALGFSVLFLTMACSPSKEGGDAKRSETPMSQQAKVTKASGFTDYAPQYPGSEIVETTNQDFDDFSSTQVHMTTNDPVSKVSDFYRASLAKSKSMPINFDESETDKLSIMAGALPDGSVATSISAKIEDGKTNIYVLLNNSKR